VVEYQVYDEEEEDMDAHGNPLPLPPNPPQQLDPNIQAMINQMQLDRNAADLRHQQTQQAILALQQQVAVQQVANPAIKPPSTIKDVLTNISEGLRTLHTTNTAPGADFVQRYERATAWYNITGNLKDAFEQAAAGNDPPAEDAGMAAIGDAIAKKISASIGKGARSSGSGKKCTRCGWPGHSRPSCFATHDSEGNELGDEPPAKRPGKGKGK